jgi:hypothetical protein
MGFWIEGMSQFTLTDTTYQKLYGKLADKYKKGAGLYRGTFKLRDQLYRRLRAYKVLFKILRQLSTVSRITR